ncbi:MAG: helix-turn-helix transcriptional regulator [Balneola sp.]
MNIFTNFGLALKEALLRENKSPAWLSRATGKDKGQISKYINGNTTPREKTQRELTKPLASEIIFNDDKEWELLDGDNSFVFQVNDSKTNYEDLSYKQAKTKLEEFFSQIKDIEVLYDEIDSNDDISDQKKLVQIQMIRNQVKSLLE